jgi:hypothetical protein
MIGTLPITESMDHRKFLDSSGRRVVLKAIQRRCKSSSQTGARRRGSRSLVFGNWEGSPGAISTACWIRIMDTAVRHPTSLAVACTKQRAFHGRTTSSRRRCGIRATRAGMLMSIHSLRTLVALQRPALAGREPHVVRSQCFPRFRRSSRTATKARCTAMSRSSC